ncbi:MAG: GTPase Era [Syntrophomonadaceae bacterium]|nr:GTPase Era [Syntrophomonadaceae bacterium]
MTKEVFRSGFVSIIGRPNVGKSTLLNKLVGHKVAIMSDKPQTTRNKILAVLNSPLGQAVFIDTPGIHKPKHKLGQYMRDVALRSLAEVDLILYVVDAGAEFGAGEEYILASLEGIDTPVFLVINKIDKIHKDQLIPVIIGYTSRREFAQVIPISALNGENTGKMLSLVWEYLTEGPMYFPLDMVTDQPERLIMAELIREKALARTKEEVPHALAVVVEEVEQRPQNTVYVSAVIYVERDSQKAIIVGKEGNMLKTIGSLARQDIEALLGSKVYLDLWVRVKKDWRKNDRDLRFFGYVHE